MYIKKAQGDVMWKINGNAPGRVICVTCVFLAPRGWMAVWLMQLNISSKHVMLQLILGMKAFFPRVDHH